MKFKKTVLKNGLRVITAPITDNPTVTVLVLVEAGSKYETKDINGISHFLEHMCFKGTKNRPNTSDISRELDTLGTHYNAFTGQELTGYYAKGRVSRLSQIFDVVSDLYLNPTLPKEEIEKEKGVICDELNMYEDTPMRHIQDVFMELVYGNQPAGWNIGGTKELVRSFNRDQFVAYRTKHYVPQATTVVIAGGIDQAKAIAMVKARFANVASLSKGKKVKVVEKQNAPQVKIVNKKTDQTHLVLGVRTFDIYNKKNAAMNVLSGVLGGGMSSRLFRKVRDEMGVGYYVRAAHDPYTDHGVLQVSAGVTSSRLEEVLKAILGELKKLTTELVTDAELAKVKEILIAGLSMNLESSDAVANYFGEQEILHKEILTPKEVEKRIKAVTAKEIRDLAQKYFVTKHLNLALIGPHTDETELAKLLHF